MASEKSILWSNSFERQFTQGENVADDVGRFHKIFFIRWWNNFTSSAGNDPTLKKAGENAPEHTEEPRWPKAGRVCFCFSLLSPALSASPHISRAWDNTQAGSREGGKEIAVFVESQQVPRVLCQSLLQPLTARACHLPKGHHAARRDSQDLAAPFMCHVKTGCRAALLSLAKPI